MEIAIALILAYLTGAIPTSVWVGKLLYSIDIREHGSGNAGATNMIRVLGLKVGIPVLAFDIFKGWLAVRYVAFFQVFTPGTDEFVNLSILLGILAVTGHIYPVYAGFRGGKGVASIFGVLLALSPVSTLSGAAVFFVSLFITKYVSLSSMVAGLSFPIWIIWVFKSPFTGLKIFSGLVALTLIYTHRKNIGRLLNGTESKASFLTGSK
jgi:glycerol-3-phosphate acyltransferase PlsY